MNEPINIQARPVQPQAHAAGFDLAELQYIFFRHKWKISLCFVAGLVVAAGIYIFNPPIYQSETKILIRYVLDNYRGMTGMAGKPADQDIKSTDPRGENIMNSELEILTTLDLAGQVAEAVGPEKILAKLGGGNERGRAASVIRRGLSVEVPRLSSIIAVRFRHPDPAVAQEVLRQLVDTYQKRHVEIHQGIGVLDESLSRQADQIRAQLSQVEDELKRLKAEAQVISLEEAKQASMAQAVRIQDDLVSAEAELAERKAALGEFARLVATTPVTNLPVVKVSQDDAEQYRKAVAELETLQKRETELTVRFAAQHPWVLRIREQIHEAETRKQQLEEATPALLTMDAPRVGGSGRTNDLSQELSRVRGLEAKIASFTNHLERIRAEAARVAASEPAILQAERKRSSLEASLQSITASLDKMRSDESLGAGKITNLSVIQTPTPAGRAIQDLVKPMSLAIIGGLVVGLGLAFLLERVLNQSIKRVVDLERTLRVPVMISVPDMAWRRKSRLRRAARNGHEPAVSSPAPPAGADKRDSSGADGGSTPTVIASAGKNQVVSWSPDHELRAYYEGLRDRLVTYFEIRNMTHKPKLVAVTSCHEGAGVTTMAAGLAAALSETGDGNVLLVDMNAEQGAAHPFHKGKPSTGLSEVLDEKKTQDAMVNENLCLVSARETNDQKLPRVLPKRFASLVPKMKASDYDFIIFDMPPVSQTSITPRLSSYMDMVLMVLESERTGQELAKRANALLNESKANVTAVLNKSRNYVPERLRQEL